MAGRSVFFDTNVLLYLLSSDQAKADRAEALLGEGGVVSVQVLNEFASVARRRIGVSWAEIRECLNAVRAYVAVEPLTLQIHESGLGIAERYGFSLYDAMIVAAALHAGCSTLWTEDLQAGQVIEGRLTVRNPFAVDPVQRG